METMASRRNQLRTTTTTTTVTTTTVTSSPSLSTSVASTTSGQSTDEASTSTAEPLQPQAHWLLGGMSQSAQLSVLIVAVLTALVIILAVLNVLVDWWAREHLSSAYAQQDDEGWFSHHHGNHAGSRGSRRPSGTLTTHHAHHGINVPSSASRRFGMMDFSLSHGGPAGRMGATRHASRLMPRL